MKRPYCKPDVIYEAFEMTQSVAACGWDLNNADTSVCGAVGDSWDFANPAITLFQSMPTCEMLPEMLNDAHSFAFCYMTGTLDEGSKIMRS